MYTPFGTFFVKAYTNSFQKKLNFRLGVFVEKTPELKPKAVHRGLLFKISI